MYLFPHSRHYRMVLLAGSKRKSKDVLNLVEVFISLDSSLRSCLNGPYERFYESFTEAFRYIEEHGLKPVGQHRTCYIDGVWNQEDPEKWLSVIQIPIE